MESTQTGEPKVLLSVDLSYQSYRASAAHPGLTSGRFFTGGLYGFYTTISKVIRETKATHLLVCADAKPYIRSTEYPDYKLNRSRSADEELLKAHKQSLRLITETLEQIGIPVWAVPGYESDDLSGYAVITYRHRFRSMFVASNDSDLFQLLWIPNLSIYGKDLDSSWTGARLMEKHGLTPDEYMLATALQGTHNCVDGIPGVGEKTSRKAVKDPALMRKYRESHGRLIDRNVSLIKLPHPTMGKQVLPPRSSKPFDHRTVYQALGRYDIDVTYSMLAALAQVMEKK